MFINESPSRKFFLYFNSIFITLITLLCILPIINVFAMSLSATQYVSAGEVNLIPKGFTLAAYKYCIMNKEFWRATLVSLERLAIGVPVNLLMTILSAYPLSKPEIIFKSRKIYVWFFLATILFSGGLIPTFIIVQKAGLIDSIWSLIIPGAVPVFNVILLMNFFRGLPKEIEESAFIDGAGHYRVLWSLFVPLSKPALATITLFCLVNHWNSWFDGLIYMNHDQNYPLQSYLQTTIIAASGAKLSMNIQDVQDLAKINDRTLRTAQLFISMIPIFLVYPLLQKYFTTGIVMGSVKG